MTDKTMTKRRLAPASLALLLLGGCSFIPEYVRPDSPVPQAWPSGPAYTDSAAALPASAGPTLADLGWQEFFRSPRLQELIETALANNRDLRVAALNVEQARAQYRIERSALLPAVDVGGSLTRQRTPADLSRTGRASVGSQWEASLGTTSFELDLFGRIRSLEQSALESFFATEQAQAATRIALIAEVANAYLTLLADQELLKLTEDTLRTQQQSFDLTRRSFDRGIGTQLDVAQARTAVETARANRAAYVRLIAQDKNALALLVGTPIDDSVLDGAPSLGTGDFVADLPVGLPSDLLQRRPDIIEAEYNLRAANANIGAARAAFFPTIGLTASAGTASAALSGLFDGGSGAWNFLPQIGLPIFDYGLREANLESTKVQREIGVAQYERAIQVAFREVSDALAAQGTLDDQLEAQSALVDATRSSYDLSILRYNRGLDSFLNALDSQRSLYAAQQDLINARLSQLSNLVTLYKVLGGGAPAEPVRVAGNPG
ncbi:efflux transporter outer membrane subunit [Skermanella rosea]|uniref:efflux transporter outer membrane subunit n=1 Tax=Skermanella rosea TaxID=1817965 RepID=UPI001E380BE5|nr:efflux transporter outer membrane subunit [Skermanella rosea]UEM04188.1 efflux transporter outer membrane subunit [Skermanella rosea]